MKVSAVGPLVYLNGAWKPLSEASVSVLDRGFLFGDGVYEVIPLYQGRFFRLDEHLERLQHSLDGIRLTNPWTPDAWRQMLTELVERNPPSPQQVVYLQVTRGVAPRDLAFPGVTPTVFAMVSALQPPTPEQREQGVYAITVSDIRWLHCDIKAITLLPNALMRQQALDAGAQDAILIRDGLAMEGAASNVFVVIDGQVITPPKGPRLLPGITRDVVLALARQEGVATREADITVEQLHAASEVWLTSSNKEIQAVTRLDDNVIGDGRPGPVWRRLTASYDTFKAVLLK